MTKSHLHFCSDCNKPYQCRISDPCHLDNAELCLRHYLARDAQIGPWPLKLRKGAPMARAKDGIQQERP